MVQPPMDTSVRQRSSIGSYSKPEVSEVSLKATGGYLAFKGKDNLVASLFGSAGSGKTMLLLNQAANLVANGQPVLFVTLDWPPNRIEKELLNLTYLDGSQLGSLVKIVDGCNKTVGLRPEADTAFNAANLVEVSLTLSEALRQGYEGAFVDPVSSLMLHNDEGAVLRAIQIIVAKLRVNVARSYLAFEEGVHSQSFYNTVRFLSDVNLTVRCDEKGNGEQTRAIRVHSSKGIALDQTWRQFHIGFNGKVTWPPRQTI